MNSEVIPSVRFSKRFLKLLGAPEHTTEIVFACAIGGVLTCTAIYLLDEDDPESTTSITWDLRLSRTSTFYKLITGEL